MRCQPACSVMAVPALLILAQFPAMSQDAPLPAPQSDYLLGCGGCHGYHGVSNSVLVPTLKGLVGYFLDTPEGRAYLGRLPNIAFADMDNEKLAAVLNYTVFEIGGSSAPAGAKPYSASEVGQLRRQPLTEVALFSYRRQIVDSLINRHDAPLALRDYGKDLYRGRE
jgi:hypothetical protein